MSLVSSDPTRRIHPDPIDHFERLPDSIILLVLNKIGDVNSLGRCGVVSRRFHSLVPQVENVVVRVDCVISDDDSFPFNSFAGNSGAGSLLRLVIGGIVKHLQALGHFLRPKRNRSTSSLSVGHGGADNGELDQGGVTHHSPTEVLRNFNEICFLRIELPVGEIGIDDGVLLKWRADFGSTLDNCVILGASYVINNVHLQVSEYGSDGFCMNNNISSGSNVGNGDDNGSIPESFYTNVGLKLRVVWTMSSLIAASQWHYLLQPIIAEYKKLDSLVLTDSDGQGVLCMNRDQLEELRLKPLSASSASKRTEVPALNMRLWYASHLELPDGVVLKDATLVALRPSEQSASKKEVSDASWLSTAFEEPYGTAAKMLVKRRTYCLEMNSF